MTRSSKMNSPAAGVSMTERLFAVVPAAGGGSRIGAAVPKQYLDLGGEPMLHRSVEALLAEPRIATIVVVLAPDDTRRPPAGRFDARVHWLPEGGATRAESVRAGLDALAAGDSDWVLVHDAARPGLSAKALARLIDTVRDDPVGGLLALPVADTLKLADSDDRVCSTLPREALWAAQTPQMFRAGVLRQALAGDLTGVTDEASGVERLGLAPRLVRGEPPNFKVTLADDLELARVLFSQGGN